MATIDVLKATVRGIGPGFTDITAAPFQVNPSSSSIMIVRNRSTGSDLVLTAVEPVGVDVDGFEGRTAVITVPAGALRVAAVVDRLADPTTHLVTYTPSGDISKADVTIIERARG